MYTQQNSHLAFFAPLIANATTDSGTLKAALFSGSSASLGEYICLKPCTITQIQCSITVLTVGTTTAPTVVFKYRPTPGSATGAVTLGTLTIPTSTAVGKVVYKAIDEQFIPAGGSVEISFTQAVGSAAGQGIPSFIANEDPETNSNNSNMIASA